MDHGLAMELIKELAVGFKGTRSYPAGHPMLDRAVVTTVSLLNRIFADDPEFSVVFDEEGITVKDVKIEPGNNIALLSLVENLAKKGVHSLTFSYGLKQEDVVNLYAVISSQDKSIEEQGGVARMLDERGTKSIIINAASAAVGSGSSALQEGTRSHEQIIEAIRGLMEVVRVSPSVSDSRTPFITLLNDIGHVGKADWPSYSEAIKAVVELLPLEKRVALLQDIEPKPFVLMMFSCLSSDTLVELMTNWERQGKSERIVKVMGAIDKEKFGQIVPLLKNRQISVYEYLNNAGVDLLREKEIASTINESDLKIALQPYYNMLEAESADVRLKVLESLIKFAKTSVAQEKYELVDGVLLHISSAIERESDERVIARFVGQIDDLYSSLRAHSQVAVSERLIEIAGTVLSRAQLSLDLRKKIIGFLSATRDTAVLPTLFSFLWESGLYPDVRSAIIGFGGDAVPVAIQFLRDAEDFAVRMKLVDILKNIGEPSIRVLTSNLQAREWFLRRNIVRIFGDIGDPRVAAVLEPLLKDEDHRVRLEVARTYGKINYKNGLMNALNDVSSEVKGEALRGLRKMIDAEEVIELLPRLSETGDEVYKELLKIIDEKKIFESVNWIAELLGRLEWRKDETADDIKKISVTTLAKLDSDSAKVILLDLQRSKDKTTASLAANALRRIG
jgi:hypothetical protein